MSVVGLDVGTSRVKAVRFDDDWRAVDVAAEPTKVIRGPGGRSEQDMVQVWRAAARTLAAVGARSPDPVALIALTAQGDGCWLVDAAGEPVGPALLWNDNRAAPMVDAWRRDGTLDRAFRISGCYGAPGLANAQLRWLLDHEPGRLRRADRLLSCGSWVYARLTGRRVLEESDAANPFLAARGGYHGDLLDLFGITGLGRLLPPVVRGADRVAPLTAEVATELGLAAGTPVALAPYDVVATAIGTGVADAGGAFGVLGTTLVVGTVADDPHLDREPNGMTLPIEDRWLIGYATMAGTEVLDWTARLLGLADAEAVIALAATATRTDPPLVLPYHSPAGERSPFLDPAVRGGILGLDLRHEPADVARGVLDGLTLVVLDCLRAAGMPRRLALSGGGARSAAWCRAICDAVDVPVTRPDVAEAGARGAALSGATAAGMFATLTDAVAVVHPGEELTPDGADAARYAEFRATRDGIRDLPATAPS